MSMFSIFSVLWTPWERCKEIKTGKETGEEGKTRNRQKGNLLVKNIMPLISTCLVEMKR